MSRSSDLRILAQFLDAKFRGPFGWRFGWDGLLGLIPVVGDAVTGSLSIYIIFRAALLGVPPAILVRMGFNVLVEHVFDIIPIVGNVFDFMWKANLKNLQLVDAYFADPHRTKRRSQFAIALTLAGLLALLIASIVAAVALLRWMISLF